MYNFQELKAAVVHIDLYAYITGLFVTMEGKLTTSYTIKTIAYFQKRKFRVHISRVFLTFFVDKIKNI